MSSRFALLVALSASLASTLAQAAAPVQNDPSLLPLPEVNTDWANDAQAGPQLTTHNSYYRITEPTPAKAAEPATQGDYAQALEGHGWDCGATGGDGKLWFGGMYGLFMGRDNPNNYDFSFVNNGTTNPDVLSLDQVNPEWGGGVEIRFGRTFCDNCWAWEAAYWGVYPGASEANIFGADFNDPFGTNLTVNNLEIGIENIQQYYNQAQRHYLRTDWEAHNIEINLLRLPCCDPCNPFRVTGLAGIRFFRFNDSFLYASDLIDTTFGNDPLDEIFYNAQVKNSLIGAQIGFLANYQMTQRWDAIANANIGVYANHMSMDQQIADGAGNIAVINNGAYDGELYDIHTSKNDVSMLGELRLGVGYRLTDNWRLTAAYRAVAITGVALSTNQIPINFGELGDARNIDSNGSLILHGAQFGAEYRY